MEFIKFECQRRGASGTDEGEGPITVKDRRLGTDRRRSRQRTATAGVFGFATVQGVRHALAGIERAT